MYLESEFLKLKHFFLLFKEDFYEANANGIIPRRPQFQV